MVRMISVSDKVYEMLKKMKGDKRSFSMLFEDLLRRKKSDVTDFFALIPDLDEHVVNKNIESMRKRNKHREM